jgi:hypothetical protein
MEPSEIRGRDIKLHLCRRIELEVPAYRDLIAKVGIEPV